MEKGETIWTESSYEDDRPRGSTGALPRADFGSIKLWTNEEAPFWVALLAVA